MTSESGIAPTARFDPRPVPAAGKGSDRYRYFWFPDSRDEKPGPPALLADTRYIRCDSMAGTPFFPLGFEIEEEDSKLASHYFRPFQNLS
jgi:hypothetical protein